MYFQESNQFKSGLCCCYVKINQRQSRVNNLTLDESAEIVFTDSRKRRLLQPQPPLQGIARVTSLKVLGVTVNEKLSVTEHVGDVINSGARSMYAISVLRSHGMCVPLLQQVFQSVVYLKAHLRCSAWWGFSTSLC